MSKPRYRCIDCHQSSDIVGHVSKRGLCAKCASVRIARNAQAMVNKTGPEYELYKNRWNAARAQGRMTYPYTMQGGDNTSY